MPFSCQLIDSALDIDELWTHTSNTRGDPKHFHLARLTSSKWLFVYNSEQPISTPGDHTSLILFEKSGSNLVVHGPQLVSENELVALGEDRRVGYWITPVSPTKAMVTLVTDSVFSHYVFSVDVIGTTMTVSNKIYPGDIVGQPSRRWGSAVGTVFPFSATQSHYYASAFDSPNAERRAHIDHSSVGVISMPDTSDTDTTLQGAGYTTGLYLDPTTGKYITSEGGNFVTHDIVGGWIEHVDDWTSINPVSSNGLDNPTPFQGVNEVKFLRHSNGKVGVYLCPGGTGAGNRLLQYQQLTLSGTNITAESLADTETVAGASQSVGGIEPLSDEVVLVGTSDGNGRVYAVETDPDTGTIVSVGGTFASLSGATGTPPSLIRQGGSGYALVVTASNPIDAYLVKVDPFGTGGWQVGSVAM